LKYNPIQYSLTRVNITLQPSVLKWARERAGLDAAALAKKLNTTEEKVSEWEREGTLTYKRAEKLAEKTHTPFGYLFLDEPPEESLPISDFRTVGSEEPSRPSPELLDVLYDALSKQAWYRDYLIEMGETRLDYIGSARLEEPTAEVARRIREHCGFDSAHRAEASDWKEALTLMFEQCEERKILVTRTGMAKGNTRRPLKVEEFRGFALSDPYAPLIFINSRDSHAAQMFTLIHEVVHLWLGLSGVSNLASTYAPSARIEQFCNQVAAEILVPMDALREQFARIRDDDDDPIRLLGRYFKVSSLVILRRLKDFGEIDAATFRDLYKREEARFAMIKARQQASGGGNYYAAKNVQVGRRFARALIGSTLEGRTPYREAYSLLGVRKAETFNKFARQLHFRV
jgi:Zn-dependent peptidase ImmA (M78 family)